MGLKTVAYVSVLQRCGVVLSAALVLGAWPVRAQEQWTVSPMELTERSAAVVHVEVLDVDYAAWDEDTGTARTAVTVRRHEVIKGDVDGEFVMYLYGGMKPSGGWTRVSTNPEFTPGHSYLLFIRSPNYRFSPFMPDPNSVLRKLSDGVATAFVNRSGHLVAVDEDGRWRIGARVAEDERALVQEQYALRGIVRSARRPEAPAPLGRNAQRAADDLLEAVRNASAQSGPMPGVRLSAFMFPRRGPTLTAPSMPVDVANPNDGGE
jgi:hypothetical protein